MMSETTANFYVAVDGDDANPGTIEKPFLTLARARDAVRELKAQGEPIQLTADTLRHEDGAGTFVGSGVTVARGDLRLECRTMHGECKPGTRRILRLVAQGAVRISFRPAPEAKHESRFQRGLSIASRYRGGDPPTGLAMS